MNNKCLGLSAVFVFACGSISNAALIVGWNFNNYTPGSSGALGVLNTSGSSEVYSTTSEILSTPTHGLVAASIDLSALAGTMGGTANNNWGLFAGDATNAVSGDVAGGALSVVGSGNNASYFTMSFSTSGYEDVVFTYATRGTGTGFTTHTWSYSVDNVTFTPLPAITGRNVTSWSTQTVNLSSISLVENQALVYLRLTLSGATATSGNNRLDNFQINAVAAVPEPSSYAVIAGAIALAGVANRRRRG